jgi:hypothetical protein
LVSVLIKGEEPRKRETLEPFFPIKRKKGKNR